jgi:hypothetical protein
VARNRFVNTNPLTRDTVKVELSDGWVLFKKELTRKENTHVNMAAFRSAKTVIGAEVKPEVEMDLEGWQPERVFTWLHGWSFADPQGNPVQFNRDNFDRLTEDSFEEIEKKLTEYIAGKEKEKNSLSPASA